MFCCCVIPVLAAENTQTVILGNTNVSVGESGRITVTTKNFGSFLGAFNLEIKFPEKVKITDVYLGENKLISLGDGGSDYNVRSGNTLVLAGTCNYGTQTDLDDNTVYYIDFIMDESVTLGEYPVVFTDDTFVVADSDDEALIFPAKADGKINVIGLKYDIDESGNVNAADVTMLKKWLIGIVQGENFKEFLADINSDGAVNIIDLVAIKHYITRSVVYLSDNGDDANSGESADAPVATLNRAIEQVYEGGTVYITDTYTLDSSFAWKKHFKPVEISGGTFDATVTSALNISDDVTFTDTTLNFNSGADIYANGYEVQMGENVIVSGKPYLYGGGTAEVESTNLKVYSGSYQYIYGGGKNADVSQDTNLTVGGNVNSELDETNHSGGVYIIGGCRNGVVGGNTNLTVEGNAKATHIFGAGIGADSVVSGKTNVQINGGAFMSAYAGSTDGKCQDTEITLSGGAIEQIFGGNQNTSMTGNARVNILGGTVKRRIYGGCYNEVSDSGSWQSQNHVNGNTTVFLSANANVQFGDFRDYGIFACSRYKSAFDNENSTVIYENSDAESKFSSKLGQQDWISKLISSWPSAAKTITT